MISTDLLAATASVLAAAIVLFHLKKFTHWSSRKVRGPTPWPIFGTNVYYLFEDKLSVDERWRRQYGKVYGLYEGYSPLLRVHDADLLNYIYVKNFRSFTDRHAEFIHEPVQRNWLLWVSGERWSARRSLISPMFSNSRMKLLAHSMSGSINRFLAEVDRRSLEAAASEDNRRELGPTGARIEKNDIMAMTMDTIGASFYSLKLDTYRDKTSEFVRRAYDLASFELGRFLAWSLTPRQIAKALTFDVFPYSKFEYFDLLAQTLISQRRRGVALGRGSAATRTSATTSAPAKYDLVQALLEASVEQPPETGGEENKDDVAESLYKGAMSDEQRGEVARMNTRPLARLSDVEIRGQMTFLFVAGFEATATAIYFCLFELAHQPRAQELIYAELERAFGDKLGALASKREQLTSEHYPILTSLAILDAFISESLRLHSPIIENTRLSVGPVALPVASHPAGRIELEKGVPISTNSFIVQRDPDYWREPDKFDHTRFLPENRHALKPGSYLPFGLGNRNCVGIRFALLEAKLAIAKIVLHHRLAPGSAEYPPKYQQNLIFLQLKPYDLLLSPRERRAERMAPGF